jgi:HEAT repeat protein
MEQSFLFSDEQMRQFITEGYVILKTDFSKQFHSDLIQQLNDVYKNEGNPGNNILPRVPDLHKVFDHPTVKGALTSVLGPDYTMHPHRHGHFNNSSSPGGWHKDDYFGHNKTRNHFPWWAMIFYFPQDVSVDMGPTGVVPGTQYYETRTFESEDPVQEVKADGEAGTFALVHYDIWHRANANTSGKERYMLKFQFVRSSVPDSPSWNNTDSEWSLPKTFSQPVYPHDIIWRQTWNWLTGKPDAEQVDTNAAADSASIAQWVKQLGDEDRAVRVKAANELGLLGRSAADEAVAAMTKALHDPFEPVALNAAYGLAKMGGKGVDSLLNALNNETEDVSRIAAYGASAARNAVDGLIECLQSDNKEAVANAAFALGELREIAASAVPALSALMKDESVYVRRNSAEALGLIGEGSAAAIEGLNRGLTDEDTQVRFMTALSCLRLGPKASETVANLTKALDDENRYVRANAADALYFIGTQQANGALFNFYRMSRWCPSTTKVSTY